MQYQSCALPRRYLSLILQYLPDLLFFFMVVWLTSLIFCPKLFKKDIYFTPFLYQIPYVMNYHNMLSEKHKEVYRLFMSFSVFLPGHAWYPDGWCCGSGICRSRSFFLRGFFRCRSFRRNRFRWCRSFYRSRFRWCRSFG